MHASLEPKGDDTWELTVVTLDKPFLFSNICGVLSSFGMDILRGHALTNPNGLVLDIFQFTDEERFLALNADGQARVLEVLEEVVSGRSTSRPGCGRANAASSIDAASRASRRSSTATISRRGATRSWRSSRTTRSACCTASAG